MCAIKGLSDKRQMPRLGKVRTGIKAKNAQGVEYPKAVDYFVVEPPVQVIYGEKPTELDIMFPVEDVDKFAAQFYRCYSSFRGLVCKGNGETCVRMVDAATGEMAHRDTKNVALKECPCAGQECEEYKAKKCKQVMNLQFLLPKVPGLGIWQLDTSSYHSIVGLNSTVDLIKNICGRIAMLPLKLTLEPREVTVDGKRKIIQTLQVRTDATLAEVQRNAAIPSSQVLLPPPDEAREELISPDLEGEDEGGAEPPLPAAAPVAEIVPPSEPPPAEKPVKAKPVAKSAEKPLSSPVEAHNQIKDWGQLCALCLHDFKMSPTAVKEILGVKDFSELVITPTEAYSKVSAARSK